MNIINKFLFFSLKMVHPYNHGDYVILIYLLRICLGIFRGYKVTKKNALHHRSRYYGEKKRRKGMPALYCL